MTEEQVRESLRQEAKNNKASDAVFHVLALRKKSLSTLYLGSLYQRMRGEGFKHPKSEYISVISVLSRLGFGKLEKDHKGRIIGIKGIMTTLQSIGKVACGQDVPLVGFRGQARSEHHEPEVRGVIMKKEPDKTEDISKVEVKLTVYINQKPLSITIPPSFDARDVIQLVNCFKD